MDAFDLQQRDEPPLTPAIPERKRDRLFLLAIGVSVLLHLCVIVWLSVRPGSPEIGVGGKANKRLDMVLSKRGSPRPPVPANPTPPMESSPAPPPVVAAQKPAHRAVPVRPRRESTPAKPRRERPANPAPLPEFIDDFPERSHAYTRESLAGDGETAAQAQAGSESLGVSPGSILNINPNIIYPRQAIQQRHEGVVVVLLHIDSQGQCSSVDLLQSSGYSELDEEVLGAVQHWRFMPPRRGHMPVESSLKHTVVFGAEEGVFDDFQKHWREIRLMPAS